MTKTLTSIIAGAVAVLSGETTAQIRLPKPDHSLGEPAFRILPNWCQHGECLSSTIEDTDPIASTVRGVLFKVSTQQWEFSYATPTRKRFSRATTTYVFCSKDLPAVLDPEEGGFGTTFLAPDKEDDYGHANELSYWFYFAVCHGKRLTAAAQPARIARQLGYRVQQRDQQPVLKRPEDILTFK